MGLFEKIFGRHDTKSNTLQNSANKRLPTLDEFACLEARERMGLIMNLGDSGKIEFFPYLRYAIEVDTDINVKFAALKRIHLFKGHPDAAAILIEMKNNGAGEKFEPYFSMALSRLNLISIEDFEKKINNQTNR